MRSNPYNVSSALWRLFSTLEVVQYIGGGDSISTVGDSSSTVEDALVLWRLLSTVVDSFSTVGDSFSTVRVVQYNGE